MKASDLAPRLQLSAPERNTATHILPRIGAEVLVEFLKKYDWSDLLAWRHTINGESMLLNHTKHWINHEHHLHLQEPPEFDENE